MSLFVRFAATLAVAMPAAALAQAVPPTLAAGEVLLQVDATGEFRSRPDVMTITAGVVTSGKTAAEAMAANAAQANRMLDAVNAAGVAPSDVQTSELSVDPVLPEGDARQPTQRPAILGYVARNSVALRLRDLGKAPAIIDALFASGANSVRGPEFSLSDPKPAQRQARQAAVAEARDEAETYAAAFGMRVARVVRASERGDFSYDGARDIMVTGSRVPRTRIEPGELVTRIHLWVDYALLSK
jgi:uncharacterized protein YggE